MIRNYMEILVNDVLSEVITNYNMDVCKNHIDDIQAVALNNLEPMYFLSSIDNDEKVAFLLDRQRRTAVLAKIIEAINQVCKNHKITERKGTD